MGAIHCARGASGAPHARCHPSRRRERLAWRYQYRVRSSAVSWDLPPLSEWLPPIPQPFWRIEAVLERGGSISLHPPRAPRDRWLARPVPTMARPSRGSGASFVVNSSHERSLRAGDKVIIGRGGREEGADVSRVRRSD